MIMGKGGKDDVHKLKDYSYNHDTLPHKSYLPRPPQIPALSLPLGEMH